jgi:hypothetical protein
VGEEVWGGGEEEERCEQSVRVGVRKFRKWSDVSPRISGGYDMVVHIWVQTTSLASLWRGTQQGI